MERPAEAASGRASAPRAATMVSVNATGDLAQGFQGHSPCGGSRARYDRHHDDREGPSGMTATAVTSLERRSASDPGLRQPVRQHPRQARAGTALLHQPAQRRPTATCRRPSAAATIPTSVSIMAAGSSAATASPSSTTPSRIFSAVDGLFDYATHTIVIGKVDAVRMPGEDIRPLIFGDGRFPGP